MTGAALKKLRDLLGGFSEVRCDGDVCIASIRLARQSTNGGSDQFHRDLMRLQPAIAEFSWPTSTASAVCDLLRYRSSTIRLALRL
jgi:hypothetical protein